MPLYLYGCTNCDHEVELWMTIAEMEEYEKNIDKHIACNAPLMRLMRPRRHITFYEGWYENIGQDPIYIKNAQHLQDACSQNGCSSNYMRDFGASAFRVKENKWI